MNGRKAKKIIESICYNEDGFVTFKGQKVEMMGQGSFRQVYDLPGTGCIVKVNYEDCEDQCGSEWKSYIALRKTQFRGNLVKQFKPFVKTNHDGEEVTMSIHRKVKGLTVYAASSPEISEQFDILANRLMGAGLDDVHDENVMVSRDKKTRRRKNLQFKVVDMGCNWGNWGNNT